MKNLHLLKKLKLKTGMRKNLVIFSCCLTLLTSCTNNTEKQTGTDTTAIAKDTTGNLPATDTTIINTSRPDSVTNATTKAIDTKADETAIAGKGSPSVQPVKTQTAVIEINVVPDAMQYDTKSFTVKAGQKVIININNPDAQQHNLVLVQIGAFNKVGAAANALAADPKGLEKQYVPQMPEVLQYTPLLSAEESYTLEFTAPKKIGDYPYMCTFPGHWSMMNGIMHVVK